MAALRGPGRWVYQAYRRAPAPVHRVGEAVLRRQATREVCGQPPLPDVSRRLLIGPLNTAGQADRWARAADALPDTSARSVAVQRRVSTPSGFDYPTDWSLTRAIQLRGMTTYRARLLDVTHVLAESAWAVLDDVFDRWITDDLPALRAAGVNVAVVIHGSELRDLRRHAEVEPHSPFRGEWDERWHRLQRTVERTRAVLQDSELPVFVTTPDMLDHAPGATLLPVVVDVERFSTTAAVLQRDRPIVLHAPSNPRLKGTAVIERVLDELHTAGVVDYRRVEGVPNAQMPAILAGADVVIDQVVLGNPGVLAAEAMAAGRLVVAHVAPRVRDRIPGLPVLEADPDTLNEVIRGIAGDRTAYQELAGRGPAWARKHHDGTAACQVLDHWLGE